MDFNPVILSIPLYFLLIGLELVFQLIKKAKIYRTNDAISNIGCGISSQVTNALWGVLSVGLYQLVYEYGAFFQIPDTWWTWLILFILVDFFYYWFHRSSHEVNFLWNTAHVVHHQSEDYNLSVALRQSSFGGVFSMLFYLPLALMGFSAYAFLTVKGLNLIYQFWIHTEAIEKLPRWFEYVFNTPSHHRVHHGRNPKYIDRNHAGTLMIWDRMFGTFQAEEEKPTYGVTKPTNTWNPVWANVLPIVDMTNQVKATPGFWNKVKVLFYKPGWQPVELGGYQMAPEVDKKTYQKFDVHPHMPMIRYVFMQFLLVLGFASLFLFTQSNYTLEIKLAMAGFIMWSIAQLGILMENRKSWIPAEYIRLLASGALIVFLIGGPLSYGFAGVFGVLFGVWLKSASKA
ncbi:Sterol desaturase/sphingolipid hydroxylase, fatty acid hydroxylase superfamily [Ekhidna lutea]|uniref:Sterol desaturase/sphingolipid hydroxylase, fatty acid hydroxylase superfamily n=1 Tax=Ekhidna lutea TaxID=447679 RepID=A0A239GPZ3_EKHLU|nr:sterol desaturase family protein [Ekhidna lutea]SNS70858.1 Sterol desaturase/sphingolipid hydroxylase, fatty acid hydroxylase superfamily [Ekhidna lutea]